MVPDCRGRLLAHAGRWVYSLGSLEGGNGS